MRWASVGVVGARVIVRVHRLSLSLVAVLFDGSRCFLWLESEYRKVVRYRQVCEMSVSLDGWVGRSLIPRSPVS